MIQLIQFEVKEFSERLKGSDLGTSDVPVDTLLKQKKCRLYSFPTASATQFRNSDPLVISAEKWPAEIQRRRLPRQC